MTSSGCSRAHAQPDHGRRDAGELAPLLALLRVRRDGRDRRHGLDAPQVRGAVDPLQARRRSAACLAAVPLTLNDMRCPKVGLAVVHQAHVLRGAGCSGWLGQAQVVHLLHLRVRGQEAGDLHGVRRHPLHLDPQRAQVVEEEERRVRRHARAGVAERPELEPGGVVGLHVVGQVPAGEVVAGDRSRRRWRSRRSRWSWSASGRRCRRRGSSGRISAGVAMVASTMNGMPWLWASVGDRLDVEARLLGVGRHLAVEEAGVVVDELLPRVDVPRLGHPAHLGAALPHPHVEELEGAAVDLGGGDEVDLLVPVASVIASSGSTACLIAAMPDEVHSAEASSAQPYASSSASVSSR